MLENLVFGGCGCRIFTYIGVLRVLEKRGLTDTLQRYAGSSGGALMAACVALGFTSCELEAVLVANLVSDRLPCLIEIVLRILKHKGVLSIHLLTTLVRSVLQVKIDPEITLAQLYSQTQKELIIVSTDLNANEYVYFHHRQYPTVRLVDAIVCSMAVPLLFTPPKLAVGDEKAYFGDPGLFTNNYPIWLFDDLEQLQTGIFVRNYQIPATTLGVNVVSSPIIPTCDIRNWRAYLRMLGQTLLNINRQIESPPAVLKQSILITSDVHPLCQPNPQQIQTMIEAGIAAAEKSIIITG